MVWMGKRICIKGGTSIEREIVHIALDLSSVWCFFFFFSKSALVRGNRIIPLFWFSLSLL